MIGGLYYRWLTWVSRWGGLWLFQAGAWCVATCYFLLFPQRVVARATFYRALLPGRSRWFYLGCVWKQFHRFTGVFLDRFLLQTGQTLTFTYDGLEYLDTALDQGGGGIILMSHVGNWEIAAHVLKRHRSDMSLLLYMGEKQKEQIEKLQKQNLAEKGVRIIVAGATAGTPYDTVEGIQHLKKGGLVSLAGDMVWHAAQRTVPVRFLEHRVDVPAGPHVFAMVAGVPLFHFFSYRTGPRSYHFTTKAPIFVNPASRSERQAAIQASAQAYAERLEDFVRKHPFEWFHFRSLFNDDECVKNSSSRLAKPEE
jgi:predicted LPLAT superfamily acyltransferase